MDHEDLTRSSAVANPGVGRREFTIRILIAIGLLATAVGLYLFVWHTADLLLLAFTGVLLGIILDTLVVFVSARLRLGHGLSLFLTILMLCVLAGAVGWAVAPQVSAQVVELRERLPEAVQKFTVQLSHYSWGKAILEQVPAAAQASAGTGKLLARVGTIFSGTVDAVVGFLVVLFVTIYSAVNPALYINGCLHLIPQKGRARARQIIHHLGYTLRWWMFGQLCSMTIVGVLTGVGLWLLGVPLALLIGIIAGILDFVPIVGTILSAIPALFLAFLDSPMKALYVVLLYIGIHSAEAHLVIPLIQQRSVALPPLVTIMALVLLGRLFGFMGIFLAAPLAATCVLLVRTVYVETMLHEDPNRQLKL